MLRGMTSISLPERQLVPQGDDKAFPGWGADSTPGYVWIGEAEEVVGEEISTAPFPEPTPFYLY